MALIDLLYAPFTGTWGELARKELDAFFEDGPYWKKAAGKVQTRVNGSTKDKNVPFAALIPKDQPDQGAYGGMSLVIFPREDGPGLLSLVVGTNGLQPDEQILSRPGHARKAAAIARWLNARNKGTVAWAKRDPVRIDRDLPAEVSEGLLSDAQAFEGVLEKYGKYIYALHLPPPDQALGEVALRTFLALCMEERGEAPKTAYREQHLADRSAWLAHTLPDLGPERLAGLLQTRRFVIVEGPPGTGKTRLAEQLLHQGYGGNGATIQFHPSTTYEDFVGGLAPVTAAGETGLRFAPKSGHLMEAARRARESDKPFLLHIDEINRADLSKVLGEAIFLLEPGAPTRKVGLAHDFGPPFHASLDLPENLHVLGTMNSADRSIAILDLAIRRRFAFVQLWPQSAVVQAHGGPVSQAAFERLLSIFLEHASDEAFDLMPGHGYFLASDDEAREALRTGVAPLLHEYLKQGFVAGFADEVCAYLDWLESR